jgi:hypothetical protein
LLSQTRLGLLSFLSNLTNLFQQLANPVTLLSQLILQSLPLAGIAQAALLAIAEIFQFLGDLLLILVQLARLAPHLAKIFRETVRGILAEVISQFIQTGLGAGSLAEGLRNLAVLQSFGRPPYVLASLFQLLALLLQALTIFLGFGLFANFVGIAKNLFLLIAEPLELAFKLFSLLLRFGLFHRRLQLSKTINQVLLA